MKEVLKKNKLKIISLFLILYFIIIYIIDINLEIQEPSLIGAIAIAIIVFGTNFIVIKNAKESRKIDYQKIIVAISIIGIIIRTVYILYTPITERQHDMERSVGHIAYIETIYKTGKLPDKNKWQFYQQPLHHIIAAGWLKINELFGVDLLSAEEGIQILTAIYSSMIIIITYCILKEINLKDIYKVIVMLIIAIHPTFIILSGSINNDILLVMLTFLDLLYIIKWDKNPGFKNTIILAILTALTALTKIAGTIIALPIIYIFLKKFIEEIVEDKKKIKKYLIKFLIFGIISLGLGLLYSIRNYKLFDQSLFYVPTPGKGTYCGDRTKIDRINIFSKEWLNLYCHPFEECNIIAYLIKSSLFGEYYIKEMPESKIASFGLNLNATLMLTLNIIIVAISIISLVKIVVKKEKRDTTLNMLIVFYIIEMFMYIYGNTTKQYACTMDFRYIVPTIFLGMMFIVKGLDEKQSKMIKFVNIVMVLFAISSILYELLGMSLLTI